MHNESMECKLNGSKLSKVEGTLATKCDFRFLFSYMGSKKHLYMHFEVAERATDVVFILRCYIFRCKQSSVHSLPQFLLPSQSQQGQRCHRPVGEERVSGRTRLLVIVGQSAAKWGNKRHHVPGDGFYRVHSFR